MNLITANRSRLWKQNYKYTFNAIKIRNHEAPKAFGGLKSKVLWILRLVLGRVSWIISQKQYSNQVHVPSQKIFSETWLPLLSDCQCWICQHWVNENLKKNPQFFMQFFYMLSNKNSSKSPNEFALKVASE